jgi:hypothetical protein
VTEKDPAADLEKWAAALRQRADDYGRLSERLHATVVTESSPDGKVRVTVDSHGVPADIYFAESARGEDPARLAAELMATLRRAQAMLAGRVRELVPAGDPVSGAIVSDYEQRFPSQPAGFRRQDDSESAVFE